MTRQSRPSKRLHAISRILLAAVTLALAIGSAGPSRSARAAPETTWVSYGLYPDISTGTKICVGEKRTVRVFLQERVAQFLPPDTTFTRLTGANIGATVSNSQAGAINPSLGVTGGDPTLQGDAEFVFTASREGTTQIRFTDYGASFGPARSLANDRVITVEVKKCEYHLVAFSDWQHPRGFRPKMNAVIDATLQLDSDLQVIPVFPKVENVARPMSYFGCVHVMEANETEVKITGRLDPADGKLHLVLDYGVVTGTSTYTCPGAQAGSVGTSEPQLFITQALQASLSAGGGGQAYPHVLQTDVNVSGTTAIIIVPSYLP